MADRDNLGNTGRSDEELNPDKGVSEEDGMSGSSSNDSDKTGDDLSGSEDSDRSGSSGSQSDGQDGNGRSSGSDSTTSNR